MRIIGGIFIFVLSLIVSTNRGVLGFFEAWAIIGGLAFVGSMICLMFGTTRLGAMPWVEMGVNELSVEDAAQMVKRHMSIWSWTGFFVCGSVGALLASMVV